MDSLSHSNDEIDKAVALRYDRELEDAPRVIAQGVGEIARKIVEVAREYGIPIYSDPELVDILLDLDYYSEIPEELYRIVAKILIFVYNLDGFVSMNRNFEDFEFDGR